MLKTTVHTHTELANWVADNSHFEDGHIIAIKENPLEILVGYNVTGNYKANSEREIVSFKLTPSKIIEWTFNKENFTPADDNYIEGIDAIENEKGICLEFSAPAVFRLTTDCLTIEEQEVIKSTFKAWVSEREIFSTASLQDIPKPEYWKEKLSEYGHNILFRYYGGAERQPEAVPYPDYQGYYVQLADRIASTQEGIFLKHLAKRNDKINFCFEFKDEKLRNVWDDITRIIADFPNARIYCGNCEFTGTEWKQFLIDKILPTSE